MTHLVQVMLYWHCKACFKVKTWKCSCHTCFTSVLKKSCTLYVLWSKTIERTKTWNSFNSPQRTHLSAGKHPFQSDLSYDQEFQQLYPISKKEEQQTCEIRGPRTKLFLSMALGHFNSTWQSEKKKSEFLRQITQYCCIL